MKKLEIDPTFLEEFGKRIKELRGALAILQNEFADALGISKSYLSEIENGNATPGIEFFYKIVAAFPVISLDYLFYGTGGRLREDKPLPRKEAWEYTPRLDSIDDLYRLMEHSVMFKNTVMGFAQKFSYENEELIRKNLIKINPEKED